MGLISKISSFFDGHVETSDNHTDGRLRTHYYKSSKDKMMRAIEDNINKQQQIFSLVDVSKERGEIAATTIKGKKGLLVLTIINVGPFKTAVDVSFTVDRGLLGSFGHRIVQQLYAELDSQFTTIKP